MSAGIAFQLVALDILREESHSAGKKSSLLTTFTGARPGVAVIQDLASHCQGKTISDEHTCCVAWYMLSYTVFNVPQTLQKVINPD